MEIEFDDAKDTLNQRKHGISLAQAHAFDLDTAQVEPDTRKDYGELRHFAIGYIGFRLHVMVFTARHNGLRVISLRKANARERKRYEKRSIH